MLKVSSTLTVTENAIPVVSAAAACTEMAVGGPGLTLIGFDVPVMEALAVSVTVTVCVPPPTVFSVTGKVLVPFVSVEFVGSVACASLLVKCTVPE